MQEAMFPAGNGGVEARNIDAAHASSTNIIYHVRKPKPSPLPMEILHLVLLL